MRKLLKYLGIGVLGLVGFIFITAIAVNKRLPEPQYGPEADALAKDMLESLNFDAWDSLNYIQWSFMDKRDYVWDKQNNVVNIKWGKYEVVLELDSKSGVCHRNNEILYGEQKEDLLQKAWRHWCNDSFWLYAPYKIFDKGTKRGIVTLKDGTRALMVSFMEGGVTPGDSYLWKLDGDNKPVSWNMWVQSLPVGGVSFSWEQWINLPGGATIATIHKNLFLNLKITNVKGGQRLSDLDLDQKVFLFL